MTITFCIPCYNDGKTIETVVKRCLLAGKRIATHTELLVVNDGSTDNSGSTLLKLQRKIKELRVITHRKNQGFGQTFRDLYTGAKNEWLFTVPGDNQIDPSEVEKLIPFLHSADMIIGLREHRQDGKKRLWQSWAYNHALRLLFGIHLFDINSVRLMKTAIMRKISLTSQSAFVEAEVTLKTIRAGFRVIEKPIGHKKRETAGAGGGKLSTIIPTIRDMASYYVRMLGK